MTHETPEDTATHASPSHRSGRFRRRSPSRPGSRLRQQAGDRMAGDRTAGDRRGRPRPAPADATPGGGGERGGPRTACRLPCAHPERRAARANPPSRRRPRLAAGRSPAAGPRRARFRLVAASRPQPPRPPAAAAAERTRRPAAGEPPRPAPPPALTTTELKPIGAEVFGLGIRRIMIDPGHGGSDTGTTVHGLMEKDLTLDIAMKLKERLEKAGFEVHIDPLERPHPDPPRALGDGQPAGRPPLRFGAPQLPAGRRHTPPASRPISSAHTDDPELLELASRENAHSGYDMASNNQLLQKLFTDARQQNSQGFARRVAATALFERSKGAIRSSPTAGSNKRRSWY